GGGWNHRDGLWDMVLIKDNHRRLAGSVAAAVAAARREAPPGMKVEVEVESEEDLREALDAKVEMVLIDNQPPETVARWVSIARQSPAPPFLEASGNMTLERVRLYALAGLHPLSVGSLTHSVTAADISLDLEPDDCPGPFCRGPGPGDRRGRLRGGAGGGAGRRARHDRHPREARRGLQHAVGAGGHRRPAPGRRSRGAR